VIFFYHISIQNTQCNVILLWESIHSILQSKCELLTHPFMNNRYHSAVSDSRLCVINHFIAYLHWLHLWTKKKKKIKWEKKIMITICFDTHNVFKCTIVSSFFFLKIISASFPANFSFTINVSLQYWYWCWRAHLSQNREVSKQEKKNNETNQIFFINDRMLCESSWPDRQFGLEFWFRLPLATIVIKKTQQR
jgi:hypothetical protein